MAIEIAKTLKKQNKKIPFATAILPSHPIPKCFLTQISISTELNVSSRVSLFMFPAVVSLPRLQLRGLNLGSQQNWTKLEEIGTNWA